MADLKYLVIKVTPAGRVIVSEHKTQAEAQAAANAANAANTEKDTSFFASQKNW